jgi:hypothetical protein
MARRSCLGAAVNIGVPICWAAAHSLPSTATCGLQLRLSASKLVQLMRAKNFRRDTSDVPSGREKVCRAYWPQKTNINGCYRAAPALSRRKQGFDSPRERQ